MIRSFRGIAPRIHPSVFVDPSAQIIGDVEIGERSSVWFNTVIRGDVNSIRIGRETSIQDLTCCHVLKDKFSLTIGNRVTVAHHVMLHGCVIEDECLVGMGAIVLDGVRLGTGSLVAAGTLLAPGTVIPPGSMVVGSPGKVKRPVSDAERDLLKRSADNYVAYSEIYRAESASG